MTTIHYGSRSLTSATRTATSTAPDDNPAGRACIGQDPELFFPVSESTSSLTVTVDEMAALAVCARCPLATRSACLMEQLGRGRAHQFGVAGGATAAQRRALLRTGSPRTKVVAHLNRQLASAASLPLAG